jgi:hypothetical protein
MLPATSKKIIQTLQASPIYRSTLTLKSAGKNCKIGKLQNKLAFFQDQDQDGGAEKALHLGGNYHYFQLKKVIVWWCWWWRRRRTPSSNEHGQ